MNLKYCFFESAAAGETRAPNEVLQELGIKFKMATAKGRDNAIWLWGCTDLPTPLPPFLTDLGMSPADAIGKGLTQEDVDFLNQQ